MVGVFNGLVGSLEVPVGAFVLQGSKAKAVAVPTPAIRSVGRLCFLPGSDVISLDYNSKQSLYNNYYRSYSIRSYVVKIYVS